MHLVRATVGRPPSLDEPRPRATCYSIQQPTQRQLPGYKQQHVHCFSLQQFQREQLSSTPGVTTSPPSCRARRDARLSSAPAHTVWNRNPSLTPQLSVAWNKRASRDFQEWRRHKSECPFAVCSNLRSAATRAIFPLWSWSLPDRPRVPAGKGRVAFQPQSPHSRVDSSSRVPEMCNRATERATATGVSRGLTATPCRVSGGHDDPLPRKHDPPVRLSLARSAG